VSTGLRRPAWDREIGKISSYLEARHCGRPLPSVSEVARKNRDPFRVLVATMISLRTKDEVTSSAAERLLSAAPTPKALSELTGARIARLIYPCGFYRVKAKNLKAAARMICRSAGHAVPRGMEELLALPGVGRKTANLVRNLGYGLPGICVDTHVHRVSNRLGWVATKTPEQTERSLMTCLPERFWIPINELLVRFGQTVCVPVSPWCSRCPARGFCSQTGVKRSR
jgi:endonuclease-3